MIKINTMNNPLDFNGELKPALHDSPAVSDDNVSSGNNELLSSILRETRDG